MYVGNMYNGNFNKGQIISSKFRESNQKEIVVQFAQTEFICSSPNFCGGSLRSNVQSDALRETDIKIIMSLDEKELNLVEKDLEYLMALTRNRKTELLPPENKQSINVYRTRENGKKICTIQVKEWTEKKDIYGDVSHDRHVIDLETITIPDLKANQQQIEETIQALAEKYPQAALKGTA